MGFLLPLYNFNQYIAPVEKPEPSRIQQFIQHLAHLAEGNKTNMAVQDILTSTILRSCSFFLLKKILEALQCKKKENEKTQMNTFFHLFIDFHDATDRTFHNRNLLDQLLGIYVYLYAHLTLFNKLKVVAAFSI